MRNNHVVLIADDEPLLLKTLTKIIKRMGHDVIAVEDGQAAIDAFHSRSTEIALVVLDMNMPKKTGAEAFQAISSVDPSKPILISSGDGFEQVMSRLDKSPAAIIPKPYNLNDLRRILSNFLP